MPGFFPAPPGRAKGRSRARSGVKGERTRRMGSLSNPKKPTARPAATPTPGAQTPIDRAMQTGLDQNNPLHRILRGGG